MTDSFSCSRRWNCNEVDAGVRPPKPRAPVVTEAPGDRRLQLLFDSQWSAVMKTTTVLQAG